MSRFVKSAGFDRDGSVRPGYVSRRFPEGVEECSATYSFLVVSVSIVKLAPVHTHTVSTATTGTLFLPTASASGQHTGRVGSRQGYSCRLVASKGSEVTDPQSPRLIQRGRNAVKGKAQLSYFTGTHESKYRMAHSTGEREKQTSSQGWLRLSLQE